MSSDTGTVAFCPGCGEVHPGASQLLEQHMKDMRTIGLLKAELARQREEAPEQKDARELFDHWVQVFRKNDNTKYTPDRQKFLLSALKTYSVDELKKAIDGLALRPWVGPRGRAAEEYPGAKKQADIEHAMSTAKRVEACWSYVDEAEQASRPKLDGPVEPADRYGVDVESGQIRWHGTATNPDWSVDVNGLELLLGRLGDRDCRVVGSGAKYSAQCPAHDDRDPSLSIMEKPDGRVLVHCHAGCKTLSVLEALGMGFADIGGACALSPSAAQRTFGAAA